MQVTETVSEGLRREFRVVVPANELEGRVVERLGEMKDRVRINGFRPGKVPVAHLKRIYGKAAMAEAIEAALRDVNTKIVTDHGFRLAMEPEIKMPEEAGAVDAVLTGRSDLSYTVTMDILPPIKLADFKSIKIEKPVAAVTDSEVEESVKKVAEQNRPFVAKPEGAKAEKGDRVTISFVGRIDGEPFEGGASNEVPIVLGSNTFIPGFEDQLIGIGAGDERVVKVSFPENYLSEKLAGKAAEFEVKAKTLEAPGEVTIGDDFAKSLGLESVAKLNEAIKTRLTQEHSAVTRQKVKRSLLDQLDEMHKFEVTPALLEQEFETMWKNVVAELEKEKKTFADEGTTEEAARADYRKIADRRVRLGLVLAEVGHKNNIRVSDEELTKAIVDRARQFPGQEQQIWDLYQKNPAAAEGLRAPIFEDKVIDFLLELVSVTEKPVSREELYREDDAEAA
ncbi:MAG TPA: trigger factor [Bauldia sp.]|nr:trigger factor [Bauldia sp.]